MIELPEDNFRGLQNMSHVVKHDDWPWASGGNMIIIDEEVWTSGSDYDLGTMVFRSLGLPDLEPGFWVTCQFKMDELSRVRIAFFLCALFGWDIVIGNQDLRSGIWLNHDCQLRLLNISKESTLVQLIKDSIMPVPMNFA